MRMAVPRALAALLALASVAHGEESRFTQRCNHPALNRTGAVEFQKKLNSGEPAVDWEADGIGRCWCLDANAKTAFRLWGRTRVVRVRPYNPKQMHVWHAPDPAGALSAMAEAQSGLLAYLARTGMTHTHSCSLISSQGECVIRSSAFQPLCIALRGSSRGSELEVSVEYDTRATLLPLALAALTFVLAPSLSHSLYCYYASGALLTAMFCVAVVVFFSLRKALGPKQAVFLGLLSYGGMLWQTTLHNLLYHQAVLLGLLSAAFGGFLLAYNNPPSERGQVSLQMTLQFAACLVVFLAAPSLTCEGAAIFLCFLGSIPLQRFYGGGGAGGTFSLLRSQPQPGGVGGGGDEQAGGSGDEGNWLSRGEPPRRVVQRNIRPQSGSSGGGQAAPGMVGRIVGRWGGGSHASPAAGGLGGGAWSTPTPKKRLTEKRYIEDNYRGPLQDQVKRSGGQQNPFHCAGAAEYISEDDYRRQTIDHTKQQEDQLMQYMRAGGGFEKYAHLLTPAARRAWAEAAGESELPEGRDDSDDE